MGCKKVINSAFWNIGGYNSRTVGNKLSSTDFSNNICPYDIVGLAETHIHCNILEDLFIPGFRLLSYANRAYNVRSKTASGGLAVFCKNEIAKYST